MNYAKQLRAYEDRLENIGEDRENLAYVFKELKQWTSLDFCFIKIKRSLQRIKPY